MRIPLLTLLLFFALTTTAQTPHDKEGHENGATGQGCHVSGDPALKVGGKVCASQGTCKTCERGEDGTEYISENTSCSSYCHKSCCHCFNPCKDSEE